MPWYEEPLDHSESSNAKLHKWSKRIAITPAIVIKTASWFSKNDTNKKSTNVEKTLNTKMLIDVEGIAQAFVYRGHAIQLKRRAFRI